MKLQNSKSGQILCAHKPYFLMPGHSFHKNKIHNLIAIS